MLRVRSRRRHLWLRLAVVFLVTWLITTIGRQALGQSVWGLHQAIASPGSHSREVALSLGGKRLDAELADTPELRSRGLMYRTDLGPNQGMLFIFDQAERHCMWMRNTPLPLSVAFIDASGRIINLADMTPFSDTAHCAARPARYAVETRQGWFAKNGVGPGDRVRGIPDRH
nr:hypothetical protein NCPCFENI_00737 [Cupriavidus sp.]